MSRTSLSEHTKSSRNSDMAWNIETIEGGRLAEHASRNLSLLYGGDRGPKAESPPSRHEPGVVPIWGRLTGADTLVPFGKAEGPAFSGVA